MNWLELLLYTAPSLLLLLLMVASVADLFREMNRCLDSLRYLRTQEKLMQDRAWEMFTKKFLADCKWPMNLLVDDSPAQGEEHQVDDGEAP